MTKFYIYIIRCIACLAVLSFSETVVARVGTLFNYRQNLSSSYVKHIYQDKLGFIWVSTQEGLNRYDGYSFLTFGEEDGLMCDNINCTIEDDEQNLYIGTTSGIFVKDRGKCLPLKRSDNDEEIKAFVSSMVVGPDGDVYFCTSGRGVWRITDTFKAEIIIEGNTEAQYCSSLLFDKKGLLWVAVDKKGVFAFKKEIVKGKDVFKLKSKFFINNDFSNAVMIVDRQDNILLGSITGGLYKMDGSRRQFSIFPGTETLPVTSMMYRNDGFLFVGTNGYGVKVINPSTGAMRESLFISNDLNISRTKVYSIFEDRNNNMWLGLMQKGVFMQTPHSSTFNCLGAKQESHNAIGESAIVAVHRMKNGTYWLAGDRDGIYSLDSNLNLIRHYETSSNGSGIPATVLSFSEDSQHRLWVGSYVEGCGIVDVATGTYQRMPFSYGNSQSVFGLCDDAQGRMWIGTLGDGVRCFDEKTGKITEFLENGSENCVCNNYVLRMRMNKDRTRLYVGTANGLSCYDIPKKSWTKTFGVKSLLQGSSISAIHDDGNNTLWIGTGKGLYQFDLKSRKMVKHYTKKDGLPDGHICAIEQDNAGLLWVSTNNGLCRINLKTGLFETYFSSDGLQGNEYCGGSSFFDKSRDMMFFGGTSGLSFINTTKISKAESNHNVIITGILIGGERVKSFMKSGSYEICNGAVSLEDHFDFCHEDNTITLNFSTLSYTSLDHISFAYSINGEEWVTMLPGSNQITLSRLSPGDYNFRVAAIDNGVRSEPKEFTIVIHNPWYFTPFARIIYLLMLIAGVWWYLRIIRQRNDERLKVQQHIHAEELNEQKLRFFVNISHEIRTPMTLIVAPLLQLMKEDKDSHRHATYDIIRRNAERILHLVNQILDLRKIDKGQMLMQMRETDLVEFTADVLKMFECQVKSRAIQLNFIHSADTIPAWIDRQQFDKIIINLMSNAMKYTPNNGEIRVTLDVPDTADSVTLRIFDNGENIPETQLAHIFERFYQANSLINQSKIGTGVGLDLTRSLVQLHHGTIEAHNLSDGVEFSVTIPLGKEHLSASEIYTAKDGEEDEHINALQQIVAETATEQEDVETEVEEVQSASAPNNRRPAVFVVEDDDEIREYLISELSSLYRVVGFPDGVDALPAILREVPQLIISDVMMPQMDGNTLCQRVKGNVNTNHVPFILLTAKTRDEDALQGLETGADLYVTKPFNMDILRRNVANLLSSRKLLENKFTGKEDQKEHIDDVQMESADERLLNRIMTVINSNLGNSDLNIDMICTEVGISRVHLHRKMKELTNQTPHDFIRNLRLKQAARLLSRKGQSITEVMYRCGFNSPTSFSTMFKKMYGVSPREYVRQQEGA